MSRLVAPALATACLAGVVPRLDPYQARWRPVVGGPVPIAFTTVAGTAVDDADEAAVALETTVLVPCVEPLLTAYADQFRLSTRVLRGNVASALAGAAGMLMRSSSMFRIGPIEAVQALLDRPSLTGAGHYVRPFDDHQDRFFVRRNCCLFYRIPGGGTCGDCVLVPDADRADMWRAALRAAEKTGEPAG
ncbi:(2Fe-2S)-binding protein [Mycolicibacterium helvum]|uniref:(2Fe-2S)-binding protein n=1 Tax=Mycolicibacterium helvum TaxID=1534349 RepID=UPI0013D5AA0A|nr:(2Fe-2S)-binding protein [Mycolicibacterium helvum]